MTYPIIPPIAPMLAKLVRELPIQDDCCYEPKWDGFRCIVFRDGADLLLSSRNEKPLNRYFPELLEALAENVPDRCVIDGEIVIAGPVGLDFDLLSQRIHPAASRIKMLAQSTPAAFVGFDALGLGNTDLRNAPYIERRRELEKMLHAARPPIYVTPMTTDPAIARDWFERFEGAGLDGVVVKTADLTYQSDKRVMWKVKHQRTADCVIGGFRWYKDSRDVGSLLLGLFDESKVLQHVGVASGFSAARRKEFVEVLEPYRRAAAKNHPWLQGDGGDQRVPGGPSRWSAGKDLTWEALRPELVAEVAYEHLQEDRFRHAASFIRWRPDRNIESCTYAQLDVPVPAELHELFHP